MLMLTPFDFLFAEIDTCYFIFSSFCREFRGGIVLN